MSERRRTELMESSLGQLGAVVITDTTVITGNFIAIQVLSDTVFATLTANQTTNDDSTQSVAADYGTVLEGTTLPGKFTAITLTSGRVIAYK